MKILIIGLGSIGVRHINNLSVILKRVEFFALRKRMLTPADKIPNNITIFSDYDKALDCKPDIVIVANPTYLHYKYAKKAIESKSHVYLEKPISHNLKNINKLLELQSVNNNVVQVGCQLRCHPHLKKIRDWVIGGKLGKVYSVVADVGEYLPSWHPWEDYRKSYAAQDDMGGGVILTLIHELDYIYWIFGSLTVEHAMGGNLTSIEINAEDTALIALKSKTGIPVHLRMDYWRRPPARTLNIVAEKGEVFWDYYKKKLTLYSKGKIIDEKILSKDWDRNDLFLDMIKDFLDSINGNKPVCSPLSDGIEV